MGRIRVLTEPLINRIAAGEVVERPASAVKELVENAIDAGAGSISVLLERGGKALIEVRDNGCGMDRDDAVLSVERHATSKVDGSADLDAIATLGFRGEALSSIAAVSRFVLRSAPADGEGTEVVVDAGRRVSVEGIGHPRGTTVRVESLFGHLPARRSFLRGDATELAHVARWLTRYALAQPERRFLLCHGERRVLDVEPAPDLQGRIAQIHGHDLARKLLPIEMRAGAIEVRGFAGRPVDALPRRDAQHVFVNGRAVQDRMLSHAVAQAYANTMPAGRYPLLFLLVDLDPALVDVNVHPQKTEVRFRDASRVHDVVRAALAGALGRGPAIPAHAELRPRAPSHAVREAAVCDWPPVPGAEPRAAAAPARAAQTAVSERRAVPLAQFRESYIVAQDEEGLVIVDQHAAHERVLFERLLAAAESGEVEVQRLLFPVTVELSPQEAVVAEHEREEFARLGFRVEGFGERTVRIDGIPALGAGLDPAGLFTELLGEAGQARSASADVRSLRRRLVTSAACQAAIKIHHPLGPPAMQALLDDLYATDNPTTCPHGRPVLFRLALEEIERTFRRR